MTSLPPIMAKKLPQSQKRPVGRIRSKIWHLKPQTVFKIWQAKPNKSFLTWPQESRTPLEGVKDSVRGEAEQPSAEDENSGAEGAKHCTRDEEDGQPSGTGASNAFKSSTNRLKNAAEKTTDKLKETIQDSASTVKDSLTGFASGAKESIENVKESTQDLTEQAKDKTAEALTGAKNSIVNVLSGAKDSITDAADSVKETSKDIATNALEAAGNAKESVSHLATGAVDHVKEASKTLIESIKGAEEGTTDQGCSHGHSGYGAPTDSEEEILPRRSPRIANKNADNEKGNGAEVKARLTGLNDKSEGEPEEKKSKQC